MFKIILKLYICTVYNWWSKLSKWVQPKKKKNKQVLTCHKTNQPTKKEANKQTNKQTYTSVDKNE